MEHIGRFAVVKKLITTSFSDIYLCRDADLDVQVVVKAFNLKDDEKGEKSMYSPPQWLARFVDEAKIMARLKHPNIVPVFELSATEDGMPYFVMPFVEANLIYEMGKDEFDPAKVAKLDAQWRPRKLTVGRVVHLLGQILDALGYLHAQGMVHRDVKPGNILLTRKEGGDVRLCDFGMVKYPGSSHSRSGVWIGTLDYMAPEQRRSAREVDARADVYSAAALAYRMLTGTLADGAFPPPHEAVPEVPRELSDLIMSALASDPGKRPRDANEMHRMLNATLVPWGRLGLSVPARPAAAEKEAVPKKPAVRFKHAGKKKKAPRAGKRSVKAKVALGPVKRPPRPEPAPAPEPAPPETPPPPVKAQPATKHGRVTVRHKEKAGGGAEGGIKLTLSPRVGGRRKDGNPSAASAPKKAGQARVVAVVRRPKGE